MMIELRYEGVALIEIDTSDDSVNKDDIKFHPDIQTERGYKQLWKLTGLLREAIAVAESKLEESNNG
jgi:DNA-binding sugar fermentation-stimulating protein